MLRIEKFQKELGSAGIWTRDLLHPKQESYPYTTKPHVDSILKGEILNLKPGSKVNITNKIKFDFL